MSARVTVVTIVAGLALAIASPALAQEATPVVPDAAFPSNMAFAPDGRLFYTELLTGDVRVVGTDGRLAEAPFASFDVYTGASETGLLGIAIPPDFTQDPWVYVYLSDARAVRNEIVAVRADGDTGTERRGVVRLLSAVSGYHNGGDLLFEPDGRLLVAVGEAHVPPLAQDPEHPGGKVLRIDPEVSTPLAGLPDGAVYTMGHRNSFGLCRDDATGAIWETENGPGVHDEVNLLTNGGNYGWPDVTGRADDARYVDPVAVFGEPVALTGCAVWRGELYVGAFLTDAVYRIGDGGSVSLVATLPGGVTDLQVGPDDRLYVAAEAGIYALGSATEGSPVPGIEGSPLPDVERRSSTPPPWVLVLATLGVLAAGAVTWRLTRRPTSDALPGRGAR